VDTNWIQGFGAEISTRWGGGAGVTRDTMQQYRQGGESDAEYLQSGLRDTPMAAVMNVTEVRSGKSMTYINHYDLQEQTGHQVGNLMLNGVDNITGQFNGVTA